MPPIELGPTRPIGAIDVRTARQAGGLRDSAKSAGEPSSAVALSDALDAGAPPVDSDRVQVIRKAVESGQYPVFPAKIADAMIAAGLLLRKGQ
jgi:negative regulator of flagellin synthesis FlgM